MELRSLCSSQLNKHFGSQLCADPVLTNLNRVDSIMLLDEGFEVVSADASDKMLKDAYKYRWERRKEPAFDNWSN